MSETKTVREPCDHGRYERHQYQTPTFITKFWCEGGKEIVLRLWKDMPDPMLYSGLLYVVEVVEE